MYPSKVLHVAIENISHAVQKGGHKTFNKINCLCLSPMYMESKLISLTIFQPLALAPHWLKLSAWFSPTITGVFYTGAFKYPLARLSGLQCLGKANMCVSDHPTDSAFSRRPAQVRLEVGDHIENKWSKSDHFERSYEVFKTKVV